jgi:hypothetical protein
MCGPKFCSMHHSRTIEEGIAKMAEELAAKETSAVLEREQLAGLASS